MFLLLQIGFQRNLRMSSTEHNPYYLILNPKTKTMKTFVLFIIAIITINTAKAQLTENLEGTAASLTAKCWILTNVYSTTTPGEVITGIGSMYSNPPTNGSSTRDIATPALNITSTSFTVSFNYKVSSKISGNATRTFEIGLLDNANNFTSLSIISMDRTSPVTVLNFNQTFTLASTGVRRVVLKLGGSTGDGNSRLIFDDFSATGTLVYGTYCNSAPIAGDDTYSGMDGSTITGNILINDSDPNGETITPSIVTNSVDGTVVLNSDGSFTFTPNPTFRGGSTTFTYRLVDNGYSPANSNVATVTLNYTYTITLPVNLVSFDAKYNKPDAILNWSTAQEKNFSHFVLEQSTDGINYNQLVIVFGAGESDTKKNYSYTDKNLAGRKGLVYYRLKSVDNDGKFDYSSVRIIRLLDEEKKGITLSTYPNPAVNELKVTIPAAWQSKKATYEVVNTNGQVARKVVTGNSSQTETINVNSLAPGFYIVRVICEGQIAQQKIIKQ